MHDDSTRAQLCSGRNRGLAAGLAMAALLCAFTMAKAAAQAHPVAIELVQPGREGLELTARLTEEGGILERNISWTVRTMDGQTVFSSEAGSVDISVPPGDYLIDAAYGAAALSHVVSLPEASRMMVSFVLRAGGLRIQSSMGDSKLHATRPRLRVFALSGGENGRLVALGVAPGEIIRLPEGRYRVESRAASGNAAAVTDIDVKAGHVSTVGITHKAGLARLAFVGSPTAQVRWDVEDESGTRVALRDGLNADLVLVPGTYRARASVGPELLTATFRIAAGETRDIMLGN